MPVTVQRALLFTSLLFPAAAFAHSGASLSGFVSGFTHPFGGVDHLLAMAAVGLLAGRFAGWHRWMLPLTFLCAMAIGGLLGMSVLVLPFVEGFIALSLVVFGGALILSRAPKLLLAATIVGAFAIFHGHAHATEMAGASPFEYSSGFLFATALLHGTGLWLASILQTRGERQQLSWRVAGSSVAVVGLAMLGISL
jgi:urease accessory protein